MLQQPTTEDFVIATSEQDRGVEDVPGYRRQYGFDAISVMPTKLNGPGDNFDLSKSHVMPC